jgi:hypothetical protein
MNRYLPPNHHGTCARAAAKPCDAQLERHLLGWTRRLGLVALFVAALFFATSAADAFPATAGSGNSEISDSSSRPLLAKNENAAGAGARKKEDARDAAAARVVRGASRLANRAGPAKLARIFRGEPRPRKRRQPATALAWHQLPVPCDAALASSSTDVSSKVKQPSPVQSICSPANAANCAAWSKNA